MSKKIKIGDCFEGDAGVPVLVCYGIDSNGWPILDDGWGDKVAANPDYFAAIPTLHLPIGNDPKKYGGAWFDLIRSGVKKEEYRELSTFYRERLCPDSGWCMNRFDGSPPIPISVSSPDSDGFVLAVFGYNDYKVLHLTNGYGHSKPQLWAHIESITIGRGNPEWGAPVDRDVFIIKLGAVFHTKNLKP